MQQLIVCSNSKVSHLFISALRYALLLVLSINKPVSRLTCLVGIVFIESNNVISIFMESRTGLIPDLAKACEAQ